MVNNQMTDIHSINVDKLTYNDNTKTNTIIPGDIMSHYSQKDFQGIPQEATQMTLDIVNGVFLGASRNIRMINDVFYLVAKNSGDKSVEDIIEATFRIGDFFKKTRGKNTPVIGNSIDQILDGLKDIKFSTKEQLLSEIERRRTLFNEQSLLNKKSIARYGANVLTGKKNILAFDYSSSVLAIFEEAANRKDYKHLIVPESRDLDGGRPIVREALCMGHTVHFILDLSILNYFGNIESIIFGAETINVDGSCYNTVGSLAISTLASLYNIPVYVATELSKLDRASKEGSFKQIKNKDYKLLLDPDGEFSLDSILFESSDLDFVPSKYISAYITEHGIVHPASISQFSD